MAPLEMLTLVVVGRLPPPTGGVATSIANLKSAMEERANEKVAIWPWSSLWKLPLVRPNVVHFHFSNPFKRLFGSIIGKLSGAKVVHTLHSNQFNFDDVCNKITCRFSDGFVLLNSDIYAEFSRRTQLRLLLATPIFSVRESLSELKSTADFGDELNVYLNSVREQGRSVALVYAYRRDYRNGLETYGFTFIGCLLPELEKLNISVIFLDPKGEYAEAEINPKLSGNFIHVTRTLDFRALVKEVDVYLRPTATDGNSVAVLETLGVGTPIVASNVVPRPPGVVLYRFNEADSFLSAVRKGLAGEGASSQPVALSPIEDYVAFIRSLDCVRNSKGMN